MAVLFKFGELSSAHDSRSYELEPMAITPPLPPLQNQDKMLNLATTANSAIGNRVIILLFYQMLTA